MMTLEDWDRVFFALIAYFPSWNPDAMVSKAWYEKMAHIEPQEVLKAVENFCLKNPSPFPPSLFQILTEVKRAKLPGESADEAWEKVRELRCRGIYDISKLSEATKFATRLVGGAQRLGELTQDELVWKKKEFVSAFEDYRERQITGQVPVHPLELEQADAKKFLAQVTQRLAK